MRSLSIVAVLLTISAVALASCSSASSNSLDVKSVSAQSFELTDDEGDARARLALSEGEPAFTLNDRSGTSRVEIKLDDAGNPVVTLFDEGGSRRVGLEFANGENPALFLRDEQGRLKAGMQVQSDGAPHLFLRNSILEDGFAVTLVDSDQPVMALADPSGANRAFLGLEDSSFNGSLVFVAEDGSIRLAVP